MDHSVDCLSRVGLSNAPSTAARPPNARLSVLRMQCNEGGHWGTTHSTSWIGCGCLDPMWQQTQARLHTLHYSPPQAHFSISARLCAMHLLAQAVRHARGRKAMQEHHSALLSGT
jgi:hypothetical protein